MGDVRWTREREAMREGIAVCKTFLSTAVSSSAGRYFFGARFREHALDDGHKHANVVEILKFVA